MTKYGTADTIHPQGGPTPHERARRAHEDAEARERREETWQVRLLDGLLGSGVLRDFPAAQADAVAADALRHLFATWAPPGDGRPLVERAAEQTLARVESALPALVEAAVADALAEGE